MNRLPRLIRASRDFNDLGILLEFETDEQSVRLMPDLSDPQFYEEFRFTRQHASILIDHLNANLQDFHYSTRGLSKETAILLRPTLQWLGTGNYLWNLRRVGECSTTTLAVCLGSDRCHRFSINDQ